MAKKAKEVVEVEPKFKQPWQGALSFLTVAFVAYGVYQWLLHPVWGLATHMIKANAFFMSIIFEGLGLGGTFGILFSISNPMYMQFYPLGYLVDWIPFFIFCIVWFVTIAFLARPFAPLKMRQPKPGLLVLALTVVLAFITWYIFAIVLKWKGYEMIVLGTCGFLIFPIWVTLFNYWPFVPKRPKTHAVIRGAVYAAMSWALTLIIYWVVNTLIWRSPIATAFTQYTLGIVLFPQLPFEPYDYWISLILSIIVGATVISIVNPWTKISQPTRGLLLLAIAIIFGLAMWFILLAILGPTSQTVLVSEPVPWLFTFPTVSHASVAAYVAFPLVTLLVGQLTFGMWPWARWGTKGNIGLVVTAFVIGTIIYYLFMVNPGFAIPLLGGNLIVPMSGLETIYWFNFGVGMMLPSTAYLWDFIVYMFYFEGLGEFVGNALMFAWILTVVIFGLLAYEAFDHWPWK